MWVIAGYGPWLATSEAITVASFSIVTNAGLVKNMPLKTEILPITAALTGLVPLTVSVVVLACLLATEENAITWHAALVPGVILMQFALICGLGFIGSTMTVFVRDFQFILPNLLMMVLFTTPILYPLASTAGLMKSISVWNPFYLISEWYRQILIRHEVPDAVSLGYVLMLALSVLILGLTFFQRCKGYFGARL